MSLLDRCWGVRDRLLADPGFRRWASAFPLTRPIARQRARALFDLCAGFVYAQVLLACVRLRLFEILHQGPQTEAALATRLGLPLDSTARLLAAAVPVRLVARRGERYALGPLGAAMIGNPGIAAMVEHHTLLYGDLADPIALLRGERPATALGRYWAYAKSEAPAAATPEQVAAYSALMTASQELIAQEVLAAYPIRRHRRLLDVGGGEGAFLAAAAAAAPELDLMLFDLPAVAERARTRLAPSLGRRAQVHGGDFLADPLPTGADIVSLVRVLHDHDDEATLALLRAARHALPVGGTLLVAEPMAGTRGAEPIGDAYFGFYLLAMGQGRPRTAEALASLLQQAGFDRVRLLSTRTPMLVRVMTASAAAVTRTHVNDT